MARERPILFRGDIVRAILEGRKTVTRRPVKFDRVPRCASDCAGPEPEHSYVNFGLRGPHAKYMSVPCKDGASQRIFCPYGDPGDRLWVRETWWNAEAYPVTGPSGEPLPAEKSHLVHYAADGDPPNTPNRHYPRGLCNGAFAAPDPYASWIKRPSIHMPRWASRLTLEVTGVAVERLQDITEEQARAEGVQRDNAPCDHVRYTCAEVKCLGPGYRSAFAGLWDAIHGGTDFSWKANPWVWVVSFKLAASASSERGEETR